MVTWVPAGGSRHSSHSWGSGPASFSLFLFLTLSFLRVTSSPKPSHSAVLGYGLGRDPPTEAQRNGQTDGLGRAPTEVTLELRWWE